MAKCRIVTTSWDDGDPRDLKLAELLRSRNLCGTFYVPLTPHGTGKTLVSADLRDLVSEGFEIGAHSCSHEVLTHVPRKDLQYEVRTCKYILEQSCGAPVLMFCYPKGRYDAEVIRQVKNAGYVGARTTRMLSLRPDFPAFKMPTTLQAYSHPEIGYLRNLGRARNLLGLFRYVTELRRYKSWVELGKTLFDQMLEHGGVWHLYGHSWEIEERSLWDDVRELLDYISHREHVNYFTNIDAFSLLNGLPAGDSVLQDCGARSIGVKKE